MFLALISTTNVLKKNVLDSFFLENSVRGKGVIRLTHCEAPTRETNPDHKENFVLSTLYFV